VGAASGVSAVATGCASGANDEMTLNDEMTVAVSGTSSSNGEGGARGLGLGRALTGRYLPTNCWTVSKPSSLPKERVSRLLRCSMMPLTGPFFSVR